MSNVNVYLHTQVIVEQELCTIIALSRVRALSREVWYKMSYIEQRGDGMVERVLLLNMLSQKRLGV